MDNPQIEITARAVVDTYNKWQTIYAAAKLTGWDGEAATAPAAVADSYAEFLAAFDALHKACHGRGRPNYPAAARRLLEAAKGSPG